MIMRMMSIVSTVASRRLPRHTPSLLHSSYRVGIPVPIIRTWTKMSPTATQQMEDLINYFPNFIENLIPAKDEHTPFYKHYRKVLEYNVPHGKLLRALGLLNAYVILHEDPGSITDDERKDCLNMAWCVELFQASGIIIDDILDLSTTRRGLDCWSNENMAGLSAVRDAISILTGNHIMLKRLFGHKRWFNDINQLFYEVEWCTAMGQQMDCLVNAKKNGTVNIDAFTISNFLSITKHKTGVYSCYFPVAVPMMMLEMNDKYDLQQTREILAKVGIHYQIYNDYFDFFDNSGELRKVGTDIQAGKCSYLAVKALEEMTPEQRQIMKENYGKEDDACVQRISDLYVELNMKKGYFDWAENSYKQLGAMIDDPNYNLPRKVMHFILNLKPVMHTDVTF